MPPGKLASNIAEQVLAGALTIVSAVLGVGDFLLLYTLVQRFLVLAQVSPWAWRWWENVSLILLVVIWLAFVYLVAYCYQRAVWRKRLWRWFAWVLLGQVSLPLLALGLVQLGAPVV